MKLIKYLIDFIKKLVSSLDNHSKGFSARKLSAFAAVTVSMYETYIHTNDNNLMEILIVWLIFALLCLSVITFQQVIQFKNGKQDSSTPSDTTPQ